MRRHAFLVLMAALTSGGSSLVAQNVLFGVHPGRANEHNCIPFGCHAVTRYQQIYSASLFDSPISIGQISFFYSSWQVVKVYDEFGYPVYDEYGFHVEEDLYPDAPQLLQPVQYTIRLSRVDEYVYGFEGDWTTPTAPVFFSGTLGESTEWGDTLSFVGSNPFAFDVTDSRPLLLDIMISALNDDGDEYPEPLPNFPNNFDYASTLYLDADPIGFSFNMSRAFQVNQAWKETATGPTLPDGEYHDSWGLVTEFGPAPPQTVVPEPATIGLLATGLLGIAGAARRRRKTGIEDS